MRETHPEISATNIVSAKSACHGPMIYYNVSAVSVYSGPVLEILRDHSRHQSLFHCFQISTPNDTQQKFKRTM